MKYENQTCMDTRLCEVGKYYWLVLDDSADPVAIEYLGDGKFNTDSDVKHVVCQNVRI